MKHTLQKQYNLNKSDYIHSPLMKRYNNKPLIEFTKKTEQNQHPVLSSDDGAKILEVKGLCPHDFFEQPNEDNVRMLSNNPTIPFLLTDNKPAEQSPSSPLALAAILFDNAPNETAEKNEGNSIEKQKNEVYNLLIESKKLRDFSISLFPETINNVVGIKSVITKLYQMSYLNINNDEEAYWVDQRSVGYIEGAHRIGTTNVQQCIAMIVKGISKAGKDCTAFAHIDAGTTMNSLEDIFEHFSQNLLSVYLIGAYDQLKLKEMSDSNIENVLEVINKFNTRLKGNKIEMKFLGEDSATRTEFQDYINKYGKKPSDIIFDSGNDTFTFDSPTLYRNATEYFISGIRYSQDKKTGYSHSEFLADKRLSSIIKIDFTNFDENVVPDSYFSLDEQTFFLSEYLSTFSNLVEFMNGYVLSNLDSWIKLKSLTSWAYMHHTRIKCAELVLKSFDKSNIDVYNIDSYNTFQDEIKELINKIKSFTLAPIELWQDDNDGLPNDAELIEFGDALIDVENNSQFIPNSEESELVGSSLSLFLHD